MTRDVLEERLRRALAASGESEPLSETEIEALGALLASRDLAAEEVAELVSDERAEELLRLFPEVEQAVDASLASRSGSGWRPWMAVAASLFMLAITLPWMLREPESAPSQRRSTEAAAIVTPIERGATLPRERFELVWEGAPKGSLYTIELATAELTVIHRESALEETSYLVPVGVFAELDSGATVLWRVEAMLPDAKTLASPTFRVRLE